MKFLHFTSPQGIEFAISTGGEIILHPASEPADPAGAKTIIEATCGTLKVRETMAEVEEKFESA